MCKSFIFLKILLFLVLALSALKTTVAETYCIEVGPITGVGGTSEWTQNCRETDDGDHERRRQQQLDDERRRQQLDEERRRQQQLDDERRRQQLDEERRRQQQLDDERSRQQLYDEWRRKTENETHLKKLEKQRDDYKRTETEIQNRRDDGKRNEAKIINQRDDYNRTETEIQNRRDDGKRIEAKFYDQDRLETWLKEKEFQWVQDKTIEPTRHVNEKPLGHKLDVMQRQDIPLTDLAGIPALSLRAMECGGVSCITADKLRNTFGTQLSPKESVKEAVELEVRFLERNASYQPTNKSTSSQLKGNTEINTELESEARRRVLTYLYENPTLNQSVESSSRKGAESSSELLPKSDLVDHSERIPANRPGRSVNREFQVAGLERIKGTTGLLVMEQMQKIGSEGQLYWTPAEVLKEKMREKNWLGDNYVNYFEKITEKEFYAKFGNDPAKWLGKPIGTTNCSTAVLDAIFRFVGGENGSINGLPVTNSVLNKFGLQFHGSRWVDNLVAAQMAAAVTDMQKLKVGDIAAEGYFDKKEKKLVLTHRFMVSDVKYNKIGELVKVRKLEAHYTKPGEDWKIRTAIRNDTWIPVRRIKMAARLYDLAE